MCPKTTAIRVHSHVSGPDPECRPRRSLPLCRIDRHTCLPIHYYCGFQKNNFRVIRLRQSAVTAEV